MKIKLSHSGKQHSYQVALALHKLGRLERFHTSVYVRSQLMQRIFNRTNNSFWTRRFIQGLPGAKVDANWKYEFKEFYLRKFYGKSESAQNAVYQRDTAFDESLSQKLGTYDFDIFWGFQGSSLMCLQKANSMGKASVCELATAHVIDAKKILAEEARLHPEWADSIDNFVFPAEYEKRLEQEPHTAKYVVAASEFTKQTLINAGVDDGKILTLPLGFDISKINFQKQNKKLSERPLRLLYVGNITQRKGIKYLLEAVKKLPKNEFELHIIGSVQGRGEALKKYDGLFTHHAPVSQYELFAQYKNYDVLVLPTVFEGFGLVIVEAMASGLPVITTSHSIGAEVIKDGENGFLVPVRDVSALQKSFEKIRNMPDEEFFLLCKKARQSVEAYSWDAYTDRVSDVLKRIDY